MWTSLKNKKTLWIRRVPKSIIKEITINNSVDCAYIDFQSDLTIFKFNLKIKAELNKIYIYIYKREISMQNNHA